MMQSACEEKTTGKNKSFYPANKKIQLQADYWKCFDAYPQGDSSFVVESLISVVIQSQTTGCHEENKSQQIVHKLEERLICSDGTPKVRHEQR